MKHLYISRGAKAGMDAAFAYLLKEYADLNSDAIPILQRTARVKQYNRNMKDLQSFFELLDELEVRGPDLLRTSKFRSLPIRHGAPFVRGRTRSKRDFRYAKGAYRCIFRVRGARVTALIFNGPRA